MNEILQKWNNLRKKIDELSLRERIILASTIVVAAWVLTIVVVVEPLLKHRNEGIAALGKFDVENNELNSKLKILKIEYSVDPNVKPRERLRELTHQLRRIEGDIQNKSQHLVPINKTSQVLQEILETQKGLYLTDLEKLDPVAVPIIETPAGNKTKEKDAAQIAEAIDNKDLDHVKALMAVVQNTDPFLKQLENQTNVYKHGVKLELEGQFLDVLEYLIALEEMNWKVYWKSFEYQSKKYPMGRASFIIETLGFENGWIGV